MRLLIAGDIRAIHLRRFAQYFRGRGHTVAIASAESDSESMPDYLIRTLPLPNFLKYPLSLSSFRKSIREFHPDLINCHFVPNYGLLGMLSRYHPLAVSIWGSDILISAAKSFLHKAKARMILRKADLLITDATILTQRALAIAGCFRSTLTVPFGVERKILELGKSRPLSSKDKLKIVSTRRLEKIYRVADLLNALREIPVQLISEAVIVGGGAKRENLARLKENIGLTNVTLTGALSHEHLLEILLSGDIYVSCAASDSTSVSLLEAMACGLFPIVTDIPGNREWINDGINGYLFPVSDCGALAQKIKSACGNADLRINAIQSNFELIEQKAVWEMNMAEVEREFDRLVR